MRANRQHEVLVAPPDSQGACRTLVEEAKPDALLDAYGDAGLDAGKWLRHHRQMRLGTGAYNIEPSNNHRRV